MQPWKVRDFVPEDLEALVRLDDLSTTTRQAPLFGLPDVVTALAARQPAVVAIAQGRVIGSAVSRVEGDRAWLLRLALAPDWRHKGLGSALLAELDNVVVFIDEVEEIAAARESGGPSVAVVNELLKALVGFRERDGRLLVCATNSVRALDSAFLRHGRFDYVLPIGPPDETARTAMWQRHLDRTGDAVDEVALVEASTNFTPADIAHAARTVAQRTFECTMDTGRRCRATTADYVAVLEGTRPTLTFAMVREFEEDIATFART